jgi:hypothetical protein
LYESEQKPEEYKKMVRPGFEPGISDSKGGVASQDTGFKFRPLHYHQQQVLSTGTNTRNICMQTNDQTLLGWL